MIIYSNKARPIPMHEFDNFDAYRSQDTMRKMAYWTRCTQEQINEQRKQIEELTALVNELRARNTDDSK
jgi:hypothetical protein